MCTFGIRRFSGLALIFTGALGGCRESPTAPFADAAMPEFARTISRTEGARHVTTLSVRMVTYAENGTSSVQMAKGSLRGEVVGGAEKAHGELVAAGRSSGFSLSVIRGNWRLHDRTEEMRDSTGARWTINTRVSKDGRQVHTDVLREGVVTRTFDDVYSAAVNGVLLLSRQTLHANGKASILVETVVNDMREDSEFSPALYRAIARSGRSEHGVLRSSAVASTPSPFVASDDGGGSTWCFYLATKFAAEMLLIVPVCSTAAIPVGAIACFGVITDAIDTYHDWLEDCAPKKK